MNQRELEPYPEIRFVAQLLASELVTNTIRHANLAPDATFVLRLEGDRHTLHVGVTDNGQGFNPLSHIARYAQTGSRKHGLYLVDALADRWGYRQDEGSTVWFEIDLLPGRRPRHGRSSAPTVPGVPNVDPGPTPRPSNDYGAWSAGRAGSGGRLARRVGRAGYVRPSRRVERND